MKINKFKNTLFYKIICFILIFSMFPWNVTSPTEVKAASTSNHQTYFIETLLNTNGGYEVQVRNDSNAFGKSLEEKEINDDYDTGNELDWYKYSYSSGATSAIGASKKIEKGSGSSNKLTNETGLPFSFPSYGRASGESYTQDYQRAIDISSTLSSSLNQYLMTLKNMLDYKGQTEDSENKDIANSIAITQKYNPAVNGTQSGNWYYIQIGGSSSKMYVYFANPQSYDYKGSADNDNYLWDEDGNLLAYFVDKGSDKYKKECNNNFDNFIKSEKGFIWAMPKGYISPKDGSALTTNAEANTNQYNLWGVANDKQADKADSAWLTIFSLAEYANAQAKYHNNTLATSANEEINFIASTIYDFVLNIYSGLLNLLKLNTIPELIYNQGTRGGSSYEAGMMNSSWWNTVLKYHLIFQIMAWMMLILAVAKILLQVNFSTVNPQLTISIMDTLQKIFTVGFALALCIPLIRAMASLNNLIVDIFQTESRTDGGNLAAFGFAGIIVLFGYLGITFTMNCIYIMRAIMIAILTASAPLFITSMAFAGPKQKGLFDNWLKEISANIFMQAVHAFAFAFLFDVMDASSVMVQLVIYFSLLPIVDSFRQLIFGNAGGFAVAQGKAASQTVGSFVKETTGGMAKGAGNLATSAIAKKMGIDAKTTDSAGSGENTSGETKAGAAGNRLNSNIAAIGDKIKSDGALGNKLAGKIQGDSKGAKVARGALKGMDQLGGSALKGASKLGDYLESTGGIMGNAVTRANLGDIQGSMNASKTHGEGLATGIERQGHDIADFAENRLQNHYQKGLDNASDNLSTAQEELKTAFKDYMGNKNSAAAGYLEEGKNNALNNVQSAKSEVNKFNEKLKKQAKRRGISSSVESNGNRSVSMNLNQVEIDSSGYATAELDEYQAQLALGPDYKSYQLENGRYVLGNNIAKSNKGSNAKFSVPSEGSTAYKKLCDYYDYDYNMNKNKVSSTSQIPINPKPPVQEDSGGADSGNGRGTNSGVNA